MLRLYTRAPATCIALAALAPATIDAQTRFAWPDTSVRLQSYTHVEECLAATTRMRMGLERAKDLTVWSDTVVRDDREGLKPEDPQLSAAATQCAARFSAAALDVHDFAPAMTLFLSAGRDSDAAALIARRLAAAPANANIERAAVVDSAIRIYASAKPARIAAASELLLHRARTTTDRIARLNTYNELMIAARNVGDTAYALRAAHLLVDVADSLTLAERHSEAFEKLHDGFGGQIIVYDALDEIAGMKARLDSLRKSTLAYTTLERSEWALATGERPDALALPIGKKSTPLIGDFWYPASAAASPHPAPGHVALVLFLEHSECIVQPATGEASSNGICAQRMAELRRIAHRFPTLEIDIALSTHGQFMYVPPMAPADEAKLIKEFVDTYQIPGANIVITATPFWRLPEPDDRRVNKAVPNVQHYTFGKSWPVGSGSLFLVDEDGTVAGVWRFGERQFNQFIDVLIQRQNKAN